MPKVHDLGSGTGGRQRGRGARVSTSLSEINVVPLVDVMLVLLIIFMVTAPMMQQGMQVNLPKSSNSKAVNAQPVYVTVPADFSRTHVVQIDKDTVRVELLQERLKQTLAPRDDKSIFIRADGAASVQDLTTVIDLLKKAGVEKVGMMTAPAPK